MRFLKICVFTRNVYSEFALKLVQKKLAISTEKKCGKGWGFIRYFPSHPHFDLFDYSFRIPRPFYYLCNPVWELLSTGFEFIILRCTKGP